MIDPVPCAHIADYYRVKWEARPCIAFNLLRYGYRQWARGAKLSPGNNLFGSLK